MAAPRVVLLPFIWVLHQLLMGALDFLPHLGVFLPRRVQGLVDRVSLGELLAKFLHHLKPSLTDGLGALLPEEGLKSNINT